MGRISQCSAIGLYRVPTASQGNNGLELGTASAIVHTAAHAVAVAGGRYSIRGADVLGVGDLMRIYAAVAPKERELIIERTKAALAAAWTRAATRDIAPTEARRRRCGPLARCGRRPSERRTAWPWR
jgi:hypothetical protein